MRDVLHAGEVLVQQLDVLPEDHAAGCTPERRAMILEDARRSGERRLAQTDAWTLLTQFFSLPLPFRMPSGDCWTALPKLRLARMVEEELREGLRELNIRSDVVRFPVEGKPGWFGVGARIWLGLGPIA